eukprot:CAMPEP_0197476916 /NCGR_PEP_ID=MMETSP1309-20131121/11707_1 /TAXON_ID=464262 /ORGANISM="Genus nov. species nov., Strain RCC998" /LENGTH=152 /DNA_ID=CAMNT_0043017539 /DNA_START=179 /DNA_END=633 /DNA_ORIENTATION=+
MADGKERSQIPTKEIDAWTRRLETDWSCAQFASGLQVNPELALAILRKNRETLSSFAKARMIIAAALVKRRVVSNLAPIEELLSELHSESDEWIRVLSVCLEKERIGGGPLEIKRVLNNSTIASSVETLRKLGQQPPTNVMFEYGNHFGRTL